MSLTPHQRSAAAKALALEAGFDLVGVARIQASPHADAYRVWLVSGKHGEMDYLARNVEERLDLSKKLPWAKCILCVALSYHQDPRDAHSADMAQPARGKIARYAWGRDYHKVFATKLRQLERRLRETFTHGGEQLEIRAYCDTGPLLERELAAAAGLGWIGKHTLLIHPRHGSWFLLGELVLSLELEPDSPVPDHCGTCRRCIEACPTTAITPYSVDGSRCISYLTLEHRSSIDDSFASPMREAGFLIGCDICQEVCPFNKEGRPLLTRETDFAAAAPAPSLTLQEILNWQSQDWDVLTRGRAFRRAKFDMWQRNARVLARQEEPAGATPTSISSVR